MMAQPEQPGDSRPRSTSLDNVLEQEGFEQAKSVLRQSLRTQRKALSEAQRADFDAQILKNLRTHLKFQKGMRIALYSPFGTEVGTKEIDLFLRRLAVEVYYPKVRKATGTLDFVRVENLSTDFEPGHFNILEPQGRASDTGLLDMVFLPGLGFDQGGGRLGQGKGYFDKALASYKGLCIGLAYGCQIVEAVPMLEHDRKVDVLISEQGVVWMNALSEHRREGDLNE